MSENEPYGSKARVFLSCGQSKKTDEVETARHIAGRLRELGFDPYIAVEEQTLRGLRENIFGQLAKSEYFIFVDFKRELLGDTGVHRGSLFSHQELALASYFEIPVIAFQEYGVKADDGLLRFLQGNATQFSDRHLLPNVIADEIRRREWDPAWRNELELNRDPGQYVDARLGNSGKTGRFFHVAVRNRHRDKTATNCYVYLEKVAKLEPFTEVPLNSVEFKWAGYTLPNAHIPPETKRKFDAFWLLHDQPTHVQFNTYADSTEYIPRIQGTGRYQLQYAVVADNFPTARMTTILDLSDSLDRTVMKAMHGRPAT